LAADIPVCSVVWTTDTTLDAMGHLAPVFPEGTPVSASANLRKLELECLRLEADCRELAGAVESPALKSHFLQMAKKWSVMAAGGLEQRYRGQDLN
jgi:hypothetical protein